MTTFRYPDKPAGELGREGLNAFDDGAYFAQLQMDGTRMLITVRCPDCVFTSRWGKRLPVGEHVRREFQRAMCELGVPMGTIFDAEWIGRPPGTLTQAIWLFDLLRIGESEDLYSVIAIDRFRTLHDLTTPRQLTHAEAAVTTHLWPGGIVPSCADDFGAFFDENTHRLDAEGIVIKKRHGQYVGSAHTCALNPGWFKCTWRNGEDGMTPVAAVAAEGGAS